ncbi:MAG: hypothetical protein KGQ42_07220 [Alphaproteobacteria bacterium]|nr:hypothetical protein [Alphaproteobacteria bacterium]MDE2043113.1 hypothetical protein [Alphaproteobacteria bacterium]MDE2341338.1 hypothetical protein [Alphaproteobacteria bacterium]
MNPTLIIASASLIGTGITGMLALKGWQGWLALKQAELDKRGETLPVNPVTTRIELADLKERLRKLEAIAAGVEL